MKDFNYYSTTTIKKPKKTDFTTTWIYNNGEVIDKVDGVIYPKDIIGKYPEGSVIQLVVDTDAYEKQNADFYREEKRLRIEFSNDCRNDMGCNHMSPTLWSSIFENAWEDGHCSGFHEVYTNLDKYVDLANIAIDSIKKDLY